MIEKPAQINRLFSRVRSPQGVWVAWQALAERVVSRVSNLSFGGMFICTPNPPPMGAAVSLLFSVPEGEIRIQSVVRNVDPDNGMGIQFTSIADEDRVRLEKLIKRLRQ